MLLRRKVLMGLGALCLMAGLSPQARADFVSSPPPTITWSQFTTGGTAYVAINAAISNPYDVPTSLTNPKLVQAGTVVSQVFQHGSLYAYVYQVQVNSTHDVGQFQVDWLASAFASGTLPVTTGKKTVSTLSPDFQITSLGTAKSSGAFSLTTLTSHVESASSVIGQDYNRLQANYAGKKGVDTSVIVVFSTLPPIVEPILSVTDSTAYQTPPIAYVYAPAPEPSAVALCGIGVLGLFGGAAYRRFRMRPSLA